MREHNNIGLYIHIPFCDKKCNYCDFYTVKSNLSTIEHFVDGLLFHINSWADELTNSIIDTIYFGGGTPSLLTLKQYDRIFNAIHNNFKVKKGLEVNIESNPENLSVEYLRGLNAFGVNRVSIGAQNVDNDILNYLGRHHKKSDIHKAIINCKDAGINNIGLDFIVGTKLDTRENIRENIRFIKDNNIKHTSFYFLKIEKGTSFFKNQEYNSMPEDDTIADNYQYIIEQLEDIDIHQYEIANFSKMGFKSEHNLKYWQCKDYLGIGPSAHSLINGRRFYYKNGINDFCHKNRDELIIYDENFSVDDYLIMGVRLLKGIELEKIFKIVNDQTSLERKINNLKAKGLIDVNNGNMVLTTKGLLISNPIINYILG